MNEPNKIITKHSGQTITSEDVASALEGPSKEATSHAHDICQQLNGSLKYWAETSVLVQMAINSATAPLGQMIKELEKENSQLLEMNTAKLNVIKVQQKALEFYWDEKNYNCDESLNDSYPLAGTQPVIKDRGAIARAALNKEKVPENRCDGVCAVCGEAASWINESCYPIMTWCNTCNARTKHLVDS